MGNNWLLFNNFTLSYYTAETGVEQLTMDKSQLTIYDLTGRRVEKMEEGIYVVGGKKMVIK